jgi:signal transduction histidine kinase
MLDDAVMMQKSQIDELTYRPSTVDLQALCQNVIETLKANAEGHLIQLQVTGNELTLTADAQLMTRAVTNLLLNAIQYSQSGSAIDVQLTNTDGEIRVAIRDQGRGIPYEEQPHLFDLFFRGSNTGEVAGAGLGLPVVKSIVELHKGRVDYESVPGKGSTFAIVLPIDQAVVGI